MGNAAHFGGGGIWLGNGTPLIDNTLIGNNTSAQSGGGIAISYASPIIQNSSIADNTADDYGGGLEAGGTSQPVLMDTTITGNTARWAGGLYVGDNVTVHISNGRVEDNNAQQAAGIRVTYATLVMTNTFVVDNMAVGGGPGAVQFWNAFGKLVNVTIADNKATGGFGGITFTTGNTAQQLDITNGILFFNDGGDLNCSGGPCNVTYSDVPESIVGSGNISADPQFVDRAAKDYHLRPGSPAIDKGTSDGAPAVDFEGDPRPVGAVDMGADEFSD
jgi:hypothetical protein